MGEVKVKFNRSRYKNNRENKTFKKVCPVLKYLPEYQEQEALA